MPKSAVTGQRMQISALRLWRIMLLAGVIGMMLPIVSMFRVVDLPATAIVAPDQNPRPIPAATPARGQLSSADFESALAPMKLASERLPAAAGASAPTTGRAKVPAALYPAADVVTAQDATTIRTRLGTIQLAGLEKLPKSSVCIADDGLWACGLQAQVALYNLIRGHDLRCDAGTRLGADTVIASCDIDGRDISRAQVETGWARPADPAALQAEVAAARRNLLGLWRGGWHLRGSE